ncbi:hypothetical protein GF312_20470 [Candidatus Poribacteria bacterium]|nr:hypothetical protein [Candidatus Poribacteria bacterium]
MAITISDIKMVPDPVVSGSKVKATCKVESDEAVDYVRIYTPDYRTITAYDDGTHGDEVAGDGIYTLEETVPYDAPAGVYDITIVAADKNGNSARKVIQMKIS